MFRVSKKVRVCEARFGFGGADLEDISLGNLEGWLENSIDKNDVPLETVWRALANLDMKIVRCDPRG